MTEKLIIKKPICLPVAPTLPLKTPPAQGLNPCKSWPSSARSAPGRRPDGEKVLTGPPGGYVRLNELNSWDDDFISARGLKSCNNTTYLSTDPRLISSSHNGDKLTLDTVPRNGKVQLNSISGKGPAEISSYKKVYNNYSDIAGGDISYYYATDLTTPFIPQLFTWQSFNIKEHYIDPMDSYKPHYCRGPIYSQNCLNWIKDSQFHREDLMSKQLWNRNQSNYEVDITTS